MLDSLDILDKLDRLDSDDIDDSEDMLLVDDSDDSEERLIELTLEMELAELIEAEDSELADSDSLEAELEERKHSSWG
ncbi:hypothetical protein C4572_02230 [Candidatus Parcubacteria bacterium]|nr:MAG: hypothetical protein C4572_02230 [Candidatus Parcubacteria bacterium]